MKKHLLNSILISAIAILIGWNNTSTAQTIAGGVWNTYFYCNGNLTAVGQNDMGQLGNGNNFYDSIPNTVIGPAGVYSMAGSYHALFVASDSTVWSTGQNYGGECGNGANAPINIPAHIAGLTSVIKVASGESHSLFLKADGTVWACGSTTNGEFGNGMITDSNVPVQCSITNVVDIAVGSYHSVFLKADGTVWTCGYNLYGQLGLGFSNTSPNALPAQVDTITNGIAVTAGDQGTMVVTADGFVWAFGFGGAYGKFAVGTSGPGSTPKKSLLTNVVDAVCGRYHSIFIKSDGTAWGAGSNYYGQLGDGTTTDADSFAVQVSGLTNITDIDLGYQHSIFLKGDGTVWAVGSNGYGQLGDGTTTPRHTPVQLNVCAASSGIDDLSNHTLVANIYPNPSNGQFQLTIDNLQSTEMLVEIYNTTGVKVYSGTTVKEQNEINVAGISKGIYYVKIWDGLKAAVKKMIVE